MLFVFLAKHVAAIRSFAAKLHYNITLLEQYNLKNLKHPTSLLCIFWTASTQITCQRCHSLKNYSYDTESCYTRSHSLPCWKPSCIGVSRSKHCKLYAEVHNTVYNLALPLLEEILYYLYRYSLCGIEL